MTRILLLAALLLPGCAGKTADALEPVWKAIDKNAVKGRISAEQAACINENEWNKHNSDLGPAVEDDRVIDKRISELLRMLEGRD
jgi:hypothetical protein